MKIVFMGTPEFAVPSLAILLDRGHTIQAVVTAPDKARGRGQEISCTPVKNFALARSLPVLQPENLKSPDFIDSLKLLEADLFVVVAFRILPREIYTIPPKGTINLHASLLPKYRGAAPINWALMNGEKETGVTTFFLQDKVDTGEMIMQERILIGENETAGELCDRLMSLGAEVLFRTVWSIKHEQVQVQKQDDALATAAPKIFREQCVVDWSKPAREVHNFIRGLSPVPGAYTKIDSKILKIYRTVISSQTSTTDPGAIVIDQGKIYVNTGNGVLEIRELQLEGKKRMETTKFLRGFQPPDHFKFG